MPRVIFAILLVIMAYLQTTVLKMLPLGGFTPNLVLVLLLLWSAVRAPRESLLWAFAIGLFLDLLTLTTLGSSALALLPVAMTGWLSRSRFFQSGIIFPMLMTLVATLAHALVQMLLAPFVGGHMNIPGVGLTGTLGAILNALFVPLLYPIVQVLHRWIDRIETYARA